MFSAYFDLFFRKMDRSERFSTSKKLSERTIRSDGTYLRTARSTSFGFFAEKENVAEKLKAKDTMQWVQKMNNIRIRATEIVSNDIIYT